MKDVMNFAGSLAAHAVWCVCGGESLIPILGVTTADGQQELNRLVYDRLEKAVEAGKAKLDAPDGSPRNAVLLYDGFITIKEWRTDAIMIDIRCYKGSDHRLLMAVPYQPKKGWFSRFVVYKPKFIECSDAAANWDELGNAFFAGVDSHTKGARIWNKHLDQSR